VVVEEEGSQAERWGGETIKRRSRKLEKLCENRIELKDGTKKSSGCNPRTGLDGQC